MFLYSLCFPRVRVGFQGAEWGLQRESSSVFNKCDFFIIEVTSIIPSLSFLVTLSLENDVFRIPRLCVSHQDAPRHPLFLYRNKEDFPFFALQGDKGHCDEVVKVFS